jgi:hypothetical protein
MADLAIEGQNIHDFIPEDEKAKLTQISCVNQAYFVVIYQRNVSHISLSIFARSNLAIIVVGQGRDLSVLRGRHTTGSPRTRLRWICINRQQGIPISFPHQYVWLQLTQYHCSL